MLRKSASVAPLEESWIRSLDREHGIRLSYSLFLRIRVPIAPINDLACRCFSSTRIDPFPREIFFFLIPAFFIPIIFSSRPKATESMIPHESFFLRCRRMRASMNR
jgi:hypothetical protein